MSDVLISSRSGLDSGSADWATSDIMVKIATSHSDASLVDKVGYIKNLSGHICNVFLEEDQRVISTTSEHLEPITPEKGDKVN